MKKILSILAILVVSLGSLSVFAQSFNTVYTWMFDNGLTTMTQTNFRPNSFVTRGEISKFFAKFAEVQGLEKTKTENQCQFSDLEGYDYTLVPTIVASCQYGLVQGHDGKYMPYNRLTEAEALTVIIRALMWMQDESKNPRWSEYHAMGEWLGILDGENVWALDTPATRETVGTRLYRASQVDTDQAEAEWTQELESILEDIFGADFFDE